MDDTLKNIRKNLTKPVVLIGLMGAGKTKIGGLLAKALDIPFVDADHEIESEAGCTIAEIFEKQGEPAFRDLERQVLERLLSGDIKVIATGGGSVMNERTAAVVWAESLSVWLKADLDLLVERTARGGKKRPLLNAGDPRAILQDLMDLRYPVYARANMTIETDRSEPEHTARRLLIALASYIEKGV